MCRICDDLRLDISIAQQELKAMPCGKKPLKAPHRTGYFREYYQANRDKKLKAANDRNKSLAESSGDKARQVAER